MHIVYIFVNHLLINKATIIIIIIILAHQHKASGPAGRRYCSKSKVTIATFIPW